MFYNLETIWQFFFLSLGLAGFVFVSWRWPHWGAWSVIFLTPLYLLKINAWPLTVLEVLIWVFVLVWLVKKIKDRQFYLLKQTVSFFGASRLAALGLILTGVFLSVLFSSDIHIGAGILKSWFLAPIIFAFVLSDILKEEHSLGGIFLALFTSSFAVAAISFAYLMLGQLTFDGRLTAFYLSPNHLAMFLTPGLIAGLGLWFEAKNNWQKFLLFIVNCLLLIVIYFTHSYGAWFGLAAAAVFILFYLWRFKMIGNKKLLAIGYSLLAVGLVIIFSQLYDGRSEKLMSLFFSSRSSWQSRLMIWQSAILILKDHWLLGIGPGLFQKYYLEYQKYFPVPYLEWAVPQPHSLFLAWWLQTGFLGFFGFIWLMVNFFKQTMFAVKHHLFSTLSSTEERGQDEHVIHFLHTIKPPLIIILMAVMVYFLVHGLVDTTFWKNDLALIFWVVIFLGCRAGRRVC